MPIPVSERVSKRREALRSAGLRPVQIWVPDTRREGFAAECVRQAVIVAQSDQNDPELMGFLDEALEELEDDLPS